MRYLLLLALFVPGCALWDATPPSATSGDPSLLVGTVTSVDLSPLAYDGDAVIMVDVDGAAVEVRVPARINLCPARDRIEFADLSVGDRIEVRGSRESDGAVRPCSEADHLLRKVGE